MKNLLTIAAVFALAFIVAGMPAETFGAPTLDAKTKGSAKLTETPARNTDFQASGIIGRPVQNHRKEYLGIIRDMMIDPRNGGIAFAIVSRGGVLGIPMNFVAVPFSALAYSPEKKVYLLDMSMEKMAAAPGFDRGELPEQASRAWETDIFRYYGLTPAWTESDEAAAGRANAYRLSKIRGASVRDSQGEKLGFIRDVVVDPDGHVPAAVVSHGGFLGMGEKWVAVPLGEMKFDREKNSFILPWTQEELDRAPAFEESKSSS